MRTISPAGIDADALGGVSATAQHVAMVLNMIAYIPALPIYLPTITLLSDTDRGLVSNEKTQSPSKGRTAGRWLWYGYFGYAALAFAQEMSPQSLGISSLNTMISSDQSISSVHWSSETTNTLFPCSSRSSWVQLALYLIPAHVYSTAANLAGDETQGSRRNFFSFVEEL